MEYDARRCRGVKLQSQNPSPGLLPPKPSSLWGVHAVDQWDTLSQASQESTCGWPVDLANVSVGLQISYCCRTNWGLGLCIPIALGLDHCLDLYKLSSRGQDTYISISPYFFSCKMEILPSLLGLCWGFRDAKHFFLPHPSSKISLPTHSLHHPNMVAFYEHLSPIFGLFFSKSSIL